MVTKNTSTYSSMTLQTTALAERNGSPGYNLFKIHPSNFFRPVKLLDTWRSPFQVETCDWNDDWVFVRFFKIVWYAHSLLVSSDDLWTLSLTAVLNPYSLWTRHETWTDSVPFPFLVPAVKSHTCNSCSFLVVRWPFWVESCGNVSHVSITWAAKKRQTYFELHVGYNIASRDPSPC